MQLLLCLLSLVAYSTAQLPELDWSPCYLSDNQPATAAASANFLERSLNRNHWQQTMDSFEEHAFGQKRQTIGTEAECAWASLPLVYSNDPAMNGTVHEDASAIQYIEVKVARYRYPGGSPLAVWHFAGGPGQDSVEVFGKYLQTFSNAYGADVYTMNLRGISGLDSSSVNFWDAMSPEQLKFQYSLMSNHTQGLLPHFNTDNNCRDLKRVIDTIYESIPKQTIVLAGHSYGTYYVHRFVQMFPSVATRAVLDSTCAGPKGTIIDMNIWANVHWFPSLIDKCGQDDFCNRVFEGKPKEVITAALASNKTCGQFSASDAFKFTAVWALNQPTNFQITFAILKRFSRCNSDDEDALNTISNMFNFEQLVDNWKTKEPVTEDLNAAVMYQMRGSELGRLPTPTPEQLATDMMQGPFGNFFPSPTDSIYACRRTNYLPWYAPSPWANRWAPSNFTKFYLISGEIDFNTPYFLTQDFMDNVPDSKLFVVPSAGHTAGLGTQCGFLVLKEYIKNGGDADSCGIPNISFQVPDAVSNALGFHNWYGSVALSNLAIGLIVGACLVVVAIIGVFVGVRMCKKKRSDEARLPLIH